MKTHITTLESHSTSTLFKMGQSPNKATVSLITWRGPLSSWNEKIFRTFVSTSKSHDHIGHFLMLTFKEDDVEWSSRSEFSRYHWPVEDEYSFNYSWFIRRSLVFAVMGYRIEGILIRKSGQQLNTELFQKLFYFYTKIAFFTSIVLYVRPEYSHDCNEKWQGYRTRFKDGLNGSLKEIKI